jgi:hypothetical protein
MASRPKRADDQEGERRSTLLAAGTKLRLEADQDAELRRVA